MYFDRDGFSSEGGGGRFATTLLGRVDAIRLINRPAMEDQLFSYVYGCEVHRDIRRPLMWTAAHHAKYGQHAPAEKLNGLVRTANRCSRPVARKHIKRAVDIGLLSEEREGKNVFYYLDPAQVKNVRRVTTLMPVIDRVVEIQAQKPKDKTAGSDLLPPEVYYNIIADGNFPEE